MTTEIRDIVINDWKMTTKNRDMRTETRNRMVWI